MHEASAFLLRHRRLLLAALMICTLFVSSSLNRSRLEKESIATSLPVLRTDSPGAAAVAACIDSRTDAHLQDVAALTALTQQENLDSRTREDAADQLQTLIRDREASAALEEALSASALAPCAAVVSGGSVTIVTAASTVTEEDSALVIALAAAHAGVSAKDVRIITAE